MHPVRGGREKKVFVGRRGHGTGGPGSRRDLGCFLKERAAKGQGIQGEDHLFKRWRDGDRGGLYLSRKGKEKTVGGSYEVRRTSLAEGRNVLPSGPHKLE